MQPTHNLVLMRPGVCYSPGEQNAASPKSFFRNEETQLPYSHSRAFYGWSVVAIAALGLFFGEPSISVFSYGVFLRAVSQDFHVGRGAIAFAFTLHNLCTASLIPLTGYVIDRFGAKRVVVEFEHTWSSTHELRFFCRFCSSVSP